MPGVPPDALAQVKKGLRGLFNRKKSKAGHQQQAAEPESTSPELPTDSAAAPAAPAHAGTDDTKDGDNAQPAEAPAHHISEPSGMEEAKAVDLNPTPATQPAKIEDGTLAPLNTKAAPSSTGMSATSGPLGDHMAEVYQEVGHTEEGAATVESEGVKGA